MKAGYFTRIGALFQHMGAIWVISCLLKKTRAGLKPDPFERMKAGKKLMEYRLRRGKWRRLKAGDIIEFGKEPDRTEKLRVEVTAVLNYKTFAALVDDFDPEHYNGKSREAQLAALLKEHGNQELGHFSIVDEQKYGVLGILVKVVSR